MLGNSPDWMKNDKTVLRDTNNTRGHILLPSPKCHAEVAGAGVEFRREIADEIPKILHQNVIASTRRRMILTVGRVSPFARRRRDLYRSHIALRNGKPVKSTADIEKMWQVVKAYRGIINMRPKCVEFQ